VDAAERVEAAVAGEEEEEVAEEGAAVVGVVVAGDNQRRNELHDTNIFVLCVALCARDFLNEMIQTGSFKSSNFQLLGKVQLLHISRIAQLCLAHTLISHEL